MPDADERPMTESIRTYSQRQLASVTTIEGWRTYEARQWANAVRERFADRVSDARDSAAMDAAAVKSAANATPAPSAEDAAIARFDASVDRMDDERHGRSG